MDLYSELINYLDEVGIGYSRDARGSECTTFRIGGPIPVLAEPRTVSEAARLFNFADSRGIAYYLIGNGSNLLIPDEGVDKLFIRFSGELNEYRLEGERLFCGAGASLAAVSKHAVASGLMGLEWAAGIPGTVGGAVAMNAGAYGGEIKNVLESAVVYRDGRVESVEVAPDDLGYRRSAFAFPGAAVLEAVFRLQSDDGGARERMEDYSARRRDKQPLNYPSAGSTFKRPEGYFAGALIEQAGLKGCSCGGAEVSRKHAGFVINRGGATADDVKKLIEHVRNTVYEKFGVMLEPEVKILG